MFSNNNRISGVQLERQFLLTWLAPLLLWLPGWSQSGMKLWSVVLGIVLLCIWIFFLSRLGYVYQRQDRYWGKAMGYVIRLIYQVYLLLSAAWILERVTDIIENYMIPGISGLLASALFAAVALGGNHRVQERGRFAQVAWPLTIGLLILLLLPALFQGNAEYLLEFDYLQIPRSAAEGKSFFVTAATYLAAFAGVSLYPYLPVRAENNSGTTGYLLRAAILLGVLFLGILLLEQMYFGNRGVEDLELPMANLMAGVRIPGAFLKRLDLIFLSLMLAALLFTLGSIYFYCGFLSGHEGFRSGRLLPAILSLLLVWLVPKTWSLQIWYPRLLRWIFLPVFLAITLGNYLVRRIYVEK